MCREKYSLSEKNFTPMQRETGHELTGRIALVNSNFACLRRVLGLSHQNEGRPVVRMRMRRFHSEHGLLQSHRFAAPAR
jgi:hypothetical protein